ncbi:hypothetical protein NPIL_432351 [Nephila pilipes]|uniref:RNase H type-1 domain-containing protein n=1 Tax=Nephila pilipes TaxID=299642 RepID=A0A8X6Q3F9_NEPPI|nr:hypothetical protein NPIL_432351 [Nephila pilipes]
MNGKIVEFQWTPSHMDIDDNERAELLAKNGRKSHMEEIVIPLDSLKRCIQEKIMLNYSMDLSSETGDKSGENIVNDWKEFSHKPRKEAVTNFRLKTRYDCLAEHVRRAGILTNNYMSYLQTDIMNKEHLLVCLGLDPILQLRGDVCLLY